MHRWSFLEWASRACTGPVRGRLRARPTRRPVGLALVLVHTTAGVSLAGVLLADGGSPTALIVLADSPTPAARAAARVLRDHVREMSGAALAILGERELGEITIDVTKTVRVGRAQSARSFVLVGESDLAQKLGVSAAGLGPGGVRIRTLPNSLVLLGPDRATPSDPWGSLYAVFVLLEDALGVRKLWPGQLGKVVPHRPTVTVGDLDLTYTPALRQRGIRSGLHNSKIQGALERLGVSNDAYQRTMRAAMETVSYEGGFPDAYESGWFRWHRLGGTLNLRSGHAFGDLWTKHGHTHPEWFALQANGSRDQSMAPTRPRLCKSNGDLIDAIAREKIAELSANPAQGSVSIAPNDGSPASFCMCGQCRALDAPDGRPVELWDYTTGTRRTFPYVSLTDRMVSFWNAIAERVTREHPEALLVADAYSVYAAPPRHQKLHPSLVIRFASLHYLSDGARRQALEDWDAWSSAARRIYFRPNLLLAGRAEGTPLLYAHRLGEDFRHLLHHGMLGTDFDSCVHHWSTQGLNYYVLAKLQWNPAADVDGVIDDYCRSGFGPAAPLIKEYFGRIERVTEATAALHRDVPRARDIDVMALYTDEVLRELDDLLDRAEARAAADAIVRRRIAFLRRGLAWSRVQRRALPVLRAAEAVDGARRARTLAERTRAGLALLREEPLAVNVGYIDPW